MKHSQRKTLREWSGFPGQAGEALLTLMLEGDVKGATRLFLNTYIGRLSVPIEILEDDGDSLIFRSEQGLFKVSNLGRKLLLQLKAEQMRLYGPGS